MTHGTDNGVFTPMLTTTDWNEEWKELQRERRAADDAAHWDERSKTFRRADSPSPYVERFLELAQVRPGESVLDMGCGTGALAVPLAAMHHEVIAADFSKGMLERTREECERTNLTGVRTMQLSWADDWADHGVGPDSVDVALASRSIATDDLKAALMKMTVAARRRACITLTTGASPRTNERLLSALGLQAMLGRDHVYAFMILAHAGLNPTVEYIVSERLDTWDTPAEARDALTKMIRDACGTRAEGPVCASALQRLPRWLETELVENEHTGEDDGRGGIQRAWRLRVPQKNTWAFLAWDCSGHSSAQS